MAKALILILFLVGCNSRKPCIYDVYQGGVKIDREEQKEMPFGDGCMSHTTGGLYYKLVEVRD